MIRIDRPYGLTSFAQQVGRGGRAGEVVDSYVIVRSQSQGSGGGSRVPRPQPPHEYSVEQVDEQALSEFLLTSSCRRAVLAEYLDGVSHGADCHSTDNIPCDQCSAQLEMSGDESRGCGSGSDGGPDGSKLLPGSEIIV